MYFHSPQDAGADVGWHHPASPGFAIVDWAKSRRWVLYVEPHCPALAAEIKRRDRHFFHALSALPHGPAPVGSVADVERFTYGFGGQRRFDDEGKRRKR